MFYQPHLLSNGNDNNLGFALGGAALGAGAGLAIGTTYHIIEDTFLSTHFDVVLQLRLHPLLSQRIFNQNAMLTKMLELTIRYNKQAWIPQQRILHH